MKSDVRTISIKYDVVVIGAGVVGAQAALQLVKKGYRVALVDGAAPGGRQSASFGNAGWLSSHSVLPPSSPGVWKQIPAWLTDPLGPLTARFPYALKASPWLLAYLKAGNSAAKISETASILRSLLKDAPSLHEAVAAEVGAEHLIDAHSGLVHAFLDKASFERVRFGWDLRRQLGIEIQELDERQLQAKEPHLSRAYKFGIFVGEAGHCKDPGQYVEHIVDHLVRHQVHLIQAQASGFTIRNGTLTGIQTNQGEIECERAVVAAGIWSKHLAGTLGDRLPLESERGYHAVVLGSDLKGPSIPLMLEDRKVVITHMNDGVRCAGQVEIAGIDAAPNWRRAQILREHLAEAFPALPQEAHASSPDNVWLGHRPSTYDGIPVIGLSPKCVQIAYACGHGHVGLVSSARTGRLISQLLSDEPTDIDITPFSIQRFSQRSAVRSVRHS